MPTVAVMVLPSADTVKPATGAAPKETLFVPAKFCPVMVMLAPGLPLVGVKFVIMGGGISSANTALDVAVPLGVTTLTAPALTPPGTVAVICVALTTVKDAAGVVPKLTAVAPVKFVPLIVITAPASAEGGAKPLIVGVGGRIVKGEADRAVPPGVVTLTIPASAPAGSVAVICPSLLTVKVISAAPILTLLTPVKPTPTIASVVPTEPLPGLRRTIFGAVIIVKGAPEAAVPLGVTTLITPVAASAGTVAVICVPLLTVKAVAGVEPNFTAVAPVKLLPVSTTLASTAPLAGAKPVSEGVALTEKSAYGGVPTPDGVRTMIGTRPLTTAGTRVWICESVLLRIGASTSPKRTDVAPASCEPLTTTFVPTAPEAGVK